MRTILHCLPLPLQCVVADRADGGPEEHAIIRRWANVQGRNCRLCDSCTFLEGDDDSGICFKAVSGPIDLARAAELGVRGGRIVYGD